METSTLRKRMPVSALLDAKIIVPAIGSAFVKLDPRTLIKNPVMFVVEVGAAAVKPRAVLRVDDLRRAEPGAAVANLRSGLLVACPRREIGGVVCGLESDQIVGIQLWNEPIMVWQRGENLRRRKRHMEEKADTILMAAIAQHLRQGDKMIIVHPDDVVGLQQFAQLHSEVKIDSPIAAEIAT
jgi:hypothetical protein